MLQYTPVDHRTLRISNLWIVNTQPIIHDYKYAYQNRSQTAVYSEGTCTPLNMKVSKNRITNYKWKAFSRQKIRIFPEPLYSSQNISTENRKFQAEICDFSDFNIYMTQSNFTWLHFSAKKLKTPHTKFNSNILTWSMINLVCYQHTMHSS